MIIVVWGLKNGTEKTKQPRLRLGCEGDIKLWQGFQVRLSRLATDWRSRVEVAPDAPTANHARTGEGWDAIAVCSAGLLALRFESLAVQ